MKRLPRDPLRFDSFSLFATRGQHPDESLKDPAVLAKFLAEVKQQAERSLENEAFLFGQRTEVMFERVVSEIGACRLLRREDVGDVFHTYDNDIQPPDFRIVLADGRHLLVEVKNFHQGKSGRKPQREGTAYLDSLARYAEVMNCELRIATYWTGWNRWTLVPLSVFERGEKWSELALGRALIVNEMNILGDLQLGTRAPLRIRMVADEERPRTLGPKGRLRYTPKSRHIYSERGEILNPTELRIAYLMALFGDWRIGEPKARLDASRQVSTVDYEIVPEAFPAVGDHPGFDMIGTLSSMVSKLHRASTSDDDGVRQLHAAYTPGAAGRLIPTGYKGTMLPLWILNVESPLARGDHSGS